MKSAYLLSDDDDLLPQAARLLRGQGASYTDGDGGLVQLIDDEGNLLNMYAGLDPAAEFEWRGPPGAVAPGVEPPDLARVTAYLVECRSEAWFAEVMKAVAKGLDQPAWVLDNNGVLWNAGEIDPERLAL